MKIERVMRCAMLTCLHALVHMGRPICSMSMCFPWQAALNKLAADKDKELEAQAQVISEFEKKAKLVQVSKIRGVLHKISQTHFHRCLCAKLSHRHELKVTLCFMRSVHGCMTA